MRRISDLIRRYPVTAFYLLVFALSWSLFALLFLGAFRGSAIQAVIAKVAVFAPALVALLITALSEAGSGRRQRGAAARDAFIIAWLAALAVFLAYYRFVLFIPISAKLLIIIAINALLVGLVLSRAFSGTPGIRRQFVTLLKPRGPIGWYAVALLTYPVILLLGMFLTRLAGHPVTFPYLGTLTLFPGAVLFFLEGLLASGGINEETGWRGFVLPRLQARYPVLVAALVVWFFWALWHLPIDIGSHTPLGQILLNRLYFNLVAALLFTLVYNRTRGSILAPALFHVAMNTAGVFIPVTPAAIALFGVAGLGAILAGRMWRRLPADSEAVYHPTAPQAGMAQ